MDSVLRAAELKNISINSFKLPSIGIIIFIKRLFENVIKEFDGIYKSWLYDSDLYPLLNPYIISIEGKRAVIILPGWGAPEAVGVMEEMIACGVKKFITVGYCGTIVKEVGIGDIVVPTEAIIDEGSSRHYFPRIRISKPSETLLKVIKNVCEKLKVKFYAGKIWSTDVPYRDTIKKIIKYRNLGCICTDMETSALFTVGTFRGVETVALRVVGNDLSELKCKPANKPEPIIEAHNKLKKIIREAIKAIPDL
jgi:uridine phosphorylase